jgi:hypothetical protein
MSGWHYSPENVTGRADAILETIADELAGFILEIEEEYNWGELILPNEDWIFLATNLVGLAEDLHTGIGIWDAYERYNIGLFQTPLPLTVPPGIDLPLGIIPERIAHYVWVLSKVTGFQDYIRPNHPELLELARDVSGFLNDRLADVPRDSGLQRLFSRPVQNAWDAMKLLVTLGAETYFFQPFYVYAPKSVDITDPEYMDSFLLRESTDWSGAGVLDILADILDIEPERKDDIRRWRYRHTAVYIIGLVSNGSMKAFTILSEREYTIRFRGNKNRIPAGNVVSGSLVEWDGEWYWWGSVMDFGKASPEKIPDIFAHLKKSGNTLLNGLGPEYLEQARNNNAMIQKVFLDLFGDNPVVFQNGLELKKAYEEFVREVHRVVPLLHGDSGGSSEGKKPSPTLENDIVEANDRIVLFHDSRDGVVVIKSYDRLVEVFGKKGNGLSSREARQVRSLFSRRSAGVEFIRKMVGWYGDGSVSAAFGITEPHKHPFLEYLLHRYKGEYFRKEYPDVLKNEESIS